MVPVQKSNLVPLNLTSCGIKVWY